MVFNQVETSPLNGQVSVSYQKRFLQQRILHFLTCVFSCASLSDTQRCMQFGLNKLISIAKQKFASTSAEIRFFSFFFWLFCCCWCFFLEARCSNAVRSGSGNATAVLLGTHHERGASLKRGEFRIEVLKILKITLFFF